MFDTAGSRLSFTVAGGLAETFRVSFWVGTRELDVTGATFSAALFEAHGSEHRQVAVLPVQHDERRNAVLVSVPPLVAGHYLWEMRAVDSAGEESRLLYGVLTALSADDVLGKVAAADASELRELAVQQAGGSADALVLRWQACSAAARQAAEAARCAERAQEAAGRAEVAAGRAQVAQEDVLGKLAAAQAFMESFNRALFEAVRVVDGYLWVGGVNTGHFLMGNDGITPHIGSDGFWYVGSLRLGDRPAFGQDGITPHITPDGFWAFGDWVSAVRAAGRDGLDGSAVRRILVGSYDEIPQEGELCHGGVLFYVPAGVERCERMASSVPSGVSVSNYTLDGPMVFSAGRSWLRRGGSLRRLGLMAGSTVSGGEPSAEALYAHVYYESGGDWVYAGHSSAAVAQVVNEVSWWDFDGLEPAPGECRVKLVLSRVAQEPSEEQVERVRVQVAGVAATEGSKVGSANYCAWAYWVFRTQELQAYDVYAWVERPEVGGAGAWVRVDENYDLATAEVFGLMRYATDVPVAGGAPVGRNADGQACVPIADAAMPGAVLPSSAASQCAGGLTHVGEDKRLYVGMASPGVPGVGRTSFARVCENTFSVGLTEDGRFAVPRAAAFQWGLSKVGTSVPQSNGMPWIIPVGQAETGVHNEYGQDITGQLMNNVLVGGALRTALKETWRGWAPNGIDVDVLPDDCNAVGLMTSGSFRQSAGQGLELVEATGSLLGGVTLCESVGGGGGMVPTRDAVVEFLRGNYYDKRQSYSRSETYSMSEVDGIVRGVKRECGDAYETKEDARTEYGRLDEAIAGRIRKSVSVDEICVLPLREYQALRVLNPKGVYFTTED